MEKNIKVKLEDLTKIYPNGDGVKNIKLDIFEDEILTLLGPSGCGKTTILRILGGFITATNGSVIIDGNDVTRLPPEKRPTGMVFQSYNLWPHMSVYENLAFGLKIRKTDKKTMRSEIKDVLSLVSMEGSERKFPNQLSGGQQQRIAIARSLLLKPSVLLLDEPFSALDAKIRLQMREELIRIQNKSKLTIVFVTHDQEEAMSLADRIVVMEKGEISQIGTPSEIYDEPSNRYVASFIGEMNFVAIRKSTVAFRPESIVIKNDNSGEYKAILENVMPLGHYYAVNLMFNNQKIKAFVPKNSTVKLHESSLVTFDITKMYTFNQ